MRITAVQTSVADIGTGVSVVSKKLPRTDKWEVSGKKQAGRGHTAGRSLYKHRRLGCRLLVFSRCSFFTLSRLAMTGKSTVDVFMTRWLSPE